MKRTPKDEQILNLQKQLGKLRQEEKELNGIGRKSYETIKVFSLVVLLICIIFQTCYIRDSLDLGGGTLAKSEVDEFNDDGKGPYNLDDNKNNTNKDNNENDSNVTNKNNNKGNNNSSSNSNHHNNSNNSNNNSNNKTNNNENVVEDNNTRNQNVIDDNTINQNKVEENETTSNDVNINNNISDNFTTESVTEQELKDIKIIQIPRSDEQAKKEDFNDLASLDIFEIVKYLDEKLIYPGITGEYKFNIENYTLKNISYKLTFAIENPKNVNILFKLKRNGTYIVGNENEYVTYDKLSQEELKLKAKTGDTYALEWKWVEATNDNDTTSKIDRANYKVDIKGEAY